MNADTLAQRPSFAPEVPESIAKYLFDDADGGLRISMTDFYMGRNGWAMENLKVLN